MLQLFERGCVFTVPFSKISGSRFAPHFHHPAFEALLKRLIAGPHAKLRAIAKLSNETWDQKSIFNDEFPYIEISSVDLISGSCATPAMTPMVKAASRARMLVRRGDLLVSLTRPTRGAICFIPESISIGVASTGFAVFRSFDETRVNREYLFHVLRSTICLRQADQRSSGGNYPAITEDELLQIIVPLPPQKMQRKVATMMSTAMNRYESRTAEATALLATIDDILLAELGIPRMPEPPNTIESRMFRRVFSRVTKKRIDPAANWKTIDFNSQKYQLQRLRDLAFINPRTRFPQMDPATLVSFVPMETVSDQFGEIADKQTREISESGTYTCFQDGDVITAKITPCMENGKAAFVTNLERGYGFGSTEFHVFRPRDNSLSAKFLLHLLRLRIIRKHARLNFTGTSGHQRVDEQFFHQLEIPLPPRADQDRIADQAEDIQERARMLINSAAADLERAKRDVEALILGKELKS